MECSIIAHREKDFHKIIQMDGLEPEDIMQSLNLKDNIHNVFKAGQGAGASGSFFFFSHDNKLIIKTMRGSERWNAQEILKESITHYQKTQNNSILARIYGMFTIKTDSFTTVDFIVMQNTVQLANKYNPKLIFDIKGNTRKRMLKIGAKDSNFWTKKLDYKGVLRDLNFLQIDRDLENQLIKLSQNEVNKINDIIKKDCRLL